MNRLFLAAFALILAVNGTVSGHAYGPNDEGNPFFVPAVRQDLVPAIDGDLSDWAFFPDEYIYNLDWFIPSGKWNEDEQLKTKDDFDLLIYGPAWVPATDQVLWAVQVVDDYFYSPDECYCMGWAEDNIQMAIDADHGGEVSLTGQMLDTMHDYQQIYVQPKLGGITGAFVDHEEMDWAFEPPYVFLEFSRRDWVEGADGSYNVEYLYQPFDHIANSSAGGIDGSRLAEWEVGEIVGLSMSVSDKDADGGNSGGVSFHFGGGSQIGGEVLADWFLLSVEDTQDLYNTATAVENSSWGRVKAALAQ